MSKMLFYVSLLIVTSSLIVNCGKEYDAEKPKNETSTPVGLDDVTKYKRTGLKGKAITIIPPIDHEHLEKTSQKFKEK